MKWTGSEENMSNHLPSKIHFSDLFIQLFNNLTTNRNPVWTDAAMDGTGKWTLVDQDDLAMETENYLDMRAEEDLWIPADDVLNVNGTTKGCMEITPSGLLNTRLDDQCDFTQERACEYTTCTTITGKKCLFPFKYMNQSHPDLTYKICSSLDVYRPWCPTKLDDQLNVLEWGDCMEHCPTEEVNSACIEEPEFPIFSDGSGLYVNYTSNYERGSGKVTNEVRRNRQFF